MTNNDALTRNRNWKSVVVIMSVLLLVLYYPVNLARTIGIKHLTAHNISSISVYMQPPPWTGKEVIRLENMTDEAFIESVLSVLSNRTMRKVYINFKRYVTMGDYSMHTDIAINFKDGSEKWVRIDYDAQYVRIETSNVSKNYKLYGSQLDIKRLHAIASEKAES